MDLRYSSGDHQDTIAYLFSQLYNSLFIGDEVRVVLWISELKNASATMRFEFYNQLNDIVAEGEQVGLFIKVDSQRPHKLSASDRARFEPYVAKG